jgi:hypothetical protein
LNECENGNAVAKCRNLQVIAAIAQTGAAVEQGLEKTEEAAEKAVDVVMDKAVGEPVAVAETKEEKEQEKKEKEQEKKEKKEKKAVCFLISSPQPSQYMSTQKQANKTPYIGSSS